MLAVRLIGAAKSKRFGQQPGRIRTLLNVHPSATHPRARSRPPRRRAPAAAVALLLLAALCAAAAGCGEAAVAGHRAQAGTTATGSTASAGATAATGATAPAGETATATASPAAARRNAVVARIDASSDAIVAEGKLHIAPGAPSDAEVRREIEAARKAGIVLPAGDSVESFAQGSRYAGAAGGEVQTPAAPWNPRSKPIADWIVSVLEWAYLHGWGGTVTSGYRSYYEQAQLNAAGAFSAPAGLSNHETTAYPGGAVDVTNPSQLISVLVNYPGPRKLVGGVLGPVDPEHFSATGD